MKMRSGERENAELRLASRMLEEIEGEGAMAGWWWPAARAPMVSFLVSSPLLAHCGLREKRARCRLGPLESGKAAI